MQEHPLGVLLIVLLLARMAIGLAVYALTGLLMRGAGIHGAEAVVVRTATGLWLVFAALWLLRPRPSSARYRR